MPRISLFIGLFVLVLAGTGCTESNETKTASNPIFAKLEAPRTNIDFTNTLTENDSLNYFTYAYIYMGGGVSAGDINNDGLTDLFFTGNMVPNKLYLNKGNLEFEDISDSAGITGDSRWYTGTTMADVNNDGFLDIYCSVGGKFGAKENQLFINNGDNTFSEQAEAYGIADPANSVQASFFDYDLDGDLDLYVANYPPTRFNAPNFYYRMKQMNASVLETDKLFKNENGHFVDVTDEAGLTTFGLSLSVTVSDLNKDGWPDLYISNDFSSPDYLFYNNQDGTFTEAVKQSTKNTSFYGMGVDIADFNNDALPDILQVDMTSQVNRRAKANMASMNPQLFWSTVNAGFHYQYMQNSLQMNNGTLRDSVADFSNVSRLAGVSSTDWSWGPLFADLDNDGWKDIFISNGTRREINNRDYFLEIEKNGVHQDSTLEKTLQIPSEKIDNYVFKNNRDLTFAKMNQDWGIEHKGFSNGCVYVDLDNDGDLEIVTNNIDDKAGVFENKCAENSHHISLSFKGSELNPFGLGTKVYLYHQGNAQYQELTLTRGFQSSVAPRLHFGLGDTETIDSLKIVWPDRSEQLFKNPDIDTQLIADYKNAVTADDVKEASLGLFDNLLADELPIEHRHIENYYDDFVNEVLLPHQTSMFGPNIAAGDLNGDGLDDLVVGAAAQNTTTLYFQTPSGFGEGIKSSFTLDSASEDMGIHIFDADGDGDEDIYIVSGGNEFSPTAKPLQDRLYINDGRGNFEKSMTALPEMLTSGSRAHSHDFDKDGDLDLFVGGRLIPGNYPSPADSYLLENIGQNEEARFVDATEKLAPFLKKSGMVTDAIWTDFNNDGWTDLIVIGEWMGIRVLQNEEGYFSEVSESWGTQDSTGWWFSIVDGDFDNDGDTDYIVGNLGLNYKYKASDDATFDIFFNDFDNNYKGDIVLSYFNEGEQFPVRGRECSSQQIPGIKQKFKDYESFSTATLEDVYTEEDLDNSLHYQVKSFASVYLENDNGTFRRHALPNMAQLSSINQLLTEDFNGDGNLDVLLVGNLHSSEVETPRNDASTGLLLLGDGQGGFEVEYARNSGFYAPGDVKDMVKLRIGEKEVIAIAKNSDYLQFLEQKSGLP